MSKEDVRVAANNKINNMYEDINQSITRVVDEVAKAQPQYSQSISNLQLDYIQAVKSTVQNTLAAQKNIADARGFSLNLPFASQYLEQMGKQMNEITDNVVRAIQTNNQVAVNALDAARDNVRIYAGISDAALELNSNTAKAWTSYFSAPQQQFFRRKTLTLF
jgi:phosphate uptake regulator